MDDITYTKGPYSATASVKGAQGDRFQGVVTVSGGSASGKHTVESTSASSEEAFEEAKALAHRILGELLP